MREKFIFLPPLPLLSPLLIVPPSFSLLLLLGDILWFIISLCTFLKRFTWEHNLGLAKLLDTFSAGSDVNIIPFDVYSLFHQAISDRTKFGLTNVTDALLEQSDDLQVNADKFFFWDAIHPTTTSHMIFAKFAFSLLALADETGLSTDKSNLTN